MRLFRWLLFFFITFSYTPFDQGCEAWSADAPTASSQLGPLALSTGSPLDLAVLPRQRMVQASDPNTPNYDINSAFGSKAFGGGKAGAKPMPQDIRHSITVYAPETSLYHSARKVLFRLTQKAPTFRQATIWGKVEWYYGTTMDYGPAAGVVIKAVHWLNGKPQRSITTATDSAGEFRLNLTVNPSSGQAARKFSAFPVMKVKRGKLPPGVKWIVTPDQQPGLQGSGSLRQPDADWKKTVFNALSMYHALQKDFADKKLGGKGTPNFDQWKKNHKAGRDSINALSMIIDIASGKATGHAQAVDNAFKAYKNMTGKPLPFEKKKLTKQQASAMKQASRDFWAWIKRNKEFAGN